MREFKLGDKVKTIAQGYGEIIYIDKVGGVLLFPIQVEFLSGQETYNIEGKYAPEDLYRSLYHADEVFQDPPRPMKKVKVGGVG